MTTTNSKTNAAAPGQAPRVAKLFKNGRSQAVRLPQEFRFEGKEVLVRRNESTGEVILAPATARPSMSFDEWFALYDAIPDDAPREAFEALPARPEGLTMEQMFRIFDRAKYSEDFFERHTSMPRELDLF